MSRELIRPLSLAERRLLEPHIEAFRRAQENLSIAVTLLGPEPGAVLDADLMAYYRPAPEPSA